MKRRTIVSAALLALASLSAAADEVGDVFFQVRPSMVQLVGAGADSRYALGSGVSLPDGSIVTNCHVTYRAKRVEPFFGSTGAKAESQRVDVTHDLCILRIPGLNLRPVEVASSRSLHVGDKVYAVGFNGGRSLSYDSGEVAELYEYDGGMVIRTTAAFSQGASGGGLFDQQGRLVGILTFFRVAGETAYFAVPVEWLDRVKELASDEIQPLSGVPFWADRLDRQPAFLQAGALEAGGKWQELAALARVWVNTSPQDGQAWVMLGKAALNTGDSATANDAFRRAAEHGVNYEPVQVH
jgi:S1-C subfamily serine protease